MSKTEADYQRSAGLTAKRILRWTGAIKTAAQTFDLPPEVIAAIISRETLGLDKWSLPPPKGQLGDQGYGHGPMQIDKRSFPEWCREWREGKLTTEDGIRKGSEVLRAKLDEVARLIPTLPPEKRLEAAVAAYNCGTGNVRAAHKRGLALDAYTTGRDYACDVLARAQVFAALLK